MKQMTVTGQNYIHKEVKSMLNSGNICDSSVQNLLSSCFLSRNIKIKMYKVYFYLLFCVCETWFLTLKEEQRWRVFENRVLRRIFGQEREELAGG